MRTNAAETDVRSSPSTSRRAEARDDDRELAARGERRPGSSPAEAADAEGPGREARRHEFGGDCNRCEHERRYRDPDQVRGQELKGEEQEEGRREQIAQGRDERAGAVLHGP